MSKGPVFLTKQKHQHYTEFLHWNAVSLDYPVDWTTGTQEICDGIQAICPTSKTEARNSNTN